jgi:hypothetical protein
MAKSRPMAAPARTTADDLKRPDVPEERITFRTRIKRYT